MSDHEPLDELRFTLGEINNPYHRAMVCAWLVALDTLERIEVTLGSIAANVDEAFPHDPEA
jgi:hypothetical protein